MLYRIHFERLVHWILRETDPEETPLVAFPGWSLVNPAVVLRDPGWKAPAETCSDAERRLVLVDALTFRMPLAPPMGPEEVIPVLKWLRFVSGQSHLIDSVVLGSPVDEDALVGKPQSASPATGWGAMRHFEMTALSHDLLTNARVPPTAEVPVYADILLDAIHANTSGDYMKTVLYCAIAIECVAANRIAAEFERACVEHPERLRLRTMELQEAKEDPVYESLRKRARRDFRTLVHELPVYVFGRSLMKDAPDLYQEVRALREHRNDFVHAGKAPTNGRDTFDLAKNALGTTFEVFHWFNAEGRFFTLHGHGLSAA